MPTQLYRFKGLLSFTKSTMEPDLTNTEGPQLRDTSKI